MTSIIDIPETVTVSCPMKRFQQRYIVKGCLKCEHYKGIDTLTESIETDATDNVTKKVIGRRKLAWHERFVIRCAFPMTRRCANITIVED